MAKLKVDSQHIVKALLMLGVLVVFIALLSGTGSSFAEFASWPSFVALLAIAAGLFWLSWRVIKPENPPRWLLWVTLGAALLRLALGIVWLFALPAGGYSTDVQQAGYIMEDAYNRDLAAWDLAKGDQPLLTSFHGYSSTDQYGGLLFLSASIYRYLGGDMHQPLMVLVLASALSGLAVAFTWAFCQRLWGKRTAQLAAWGLALYPEAILLGSSQMREAFTVCLVSVSLYGLLRIHEEMNLSNLTLLAVPLFLIAPLTWAFLPSVLLLLVLAYMALDNWRWLRNRRVWLAIAFIAIIGTAAFWVFAGGQDLWLVQSAKWQAYVSANASGWVERQFERLPLFAQIPFLVVYGIFRPLLPAAIVATGPAVWTVIGVWRALGWTILLALLVYASYLTFRSRDWLRIPGALLFSTWVVGIAASYRGGGDLWDSPRYRSAFAAIQVGLAAWAWVRYKETSDPWLRRAVVSAVLMIAWFIPWYLRRYTAFDWPIVNLQQVVGLGLVSAALFVTWDWINKS